MKKKDYEELGELKQVIYDHIYAAFNEKKYELILEYPYFGFDGYVNATVTICGMDLRCAINEKKYICWFDGGIIGAMIERVPHMVYRIVAQAKRIIKENEIESRKRRIKQLQNELKQLQKINK